MLKQVYGAIRDAIYPEFDSNRRGFFNTTKEYTLGGLALLTSLNTFIKFFTDGVAYAGEYKRNDKFVEENWDLVIPQINGLLNYLTQREREVYLSFVKYMQSQYVNELKKCDAIDNVEDKAYCIVEAHEELKSIGFYIPETIIANKPNKEDPNVERIVERWKKNIDELKNIHIGDIKILGKVSRESKIINHLMNNDIKSILEIYDRALYRGYEFQTLYPVAYKKVMLMLYADKTDIKKYITTNTYVYFNKNAPLVLIGGNNITVTPILKIDEIYNVKKVSYPIIEAELKVLQIKYTEGMLVFKEGMRFRKTTKPHIIKYKIEQPRTTIIQIPSVSIAKLNKK